MKAFKAWWVSCFDSPVPGKGSVAWEAWRTAVEAAAKIAEDKGQVDLARQIRSELKWTN